MQKRILSAALPMLLLTMTVLLTTAATDEKRPEHCVTYLEPLGPGQEPGEVVAKPVAMGWYETYAEALLVGSDGVTELPAGVSPADLTQAILDQATADTTSTSYLLGTEFVDTGYGGSSCDHNKKFEHADFGGAVLTCTPNCNTYGVLNDEVSSLRWKD